MKKLSYFLNKIISFLKKISIISQITIIYTSTSTILFLTLGKIFIKHTPIVVFLIQTSFLLVFTHFEALTIEDICQTYNASLSEESKNLVLEETKKILNEIYIPELENKTLNKIKDDFYFNLIENSQENYKEITPSDFYTPTNIILAFSTIAIIIFIYN